MAEHPFVILDVFTETPLAGNQLGVFTEGHRVPPGIRQTLARELNFSETVFVEPPTGAGDARIRIHTPAEEIPFAGHPVLGAAVTLTGADARERITLETGAGAIPVELEHRSRTLAHGRMTQPIPAVRSHPDPAAVLGALGVSESVLPVDIYDNGAAYVYVTLTDAAAVARVRPDLERLARLAGDGTAPLFGFCVVAGAGTRWKMRMFAPADGVPEDPATGSAAGPLAVHAARHGLIRFGDGIEVSQGDEIGRPSALRAIAYGAASAVERVVVGGAAVIVARGSFGL